ncbi:HvfC/BufC family peptide modification chaperone [Nannocystis bainbridge]|uniref:DNA-binding domain-containing protein n=1 Tax=Nannocystis bainbridge TaxID=2995303 RepID=A0ABT5E8Z5_9BACT|nr:putative DNA-binding domain-containing protein [Nannocystis bainbridge]MDC0721383.1 putative DNA-binding domain-containing protein [Nannocystis bainbridge]
MRLAGLFSTLQPLIEGTADAATVAKSLAIEGAAEGLQVYAEMCRKLRRDAIDVIHAGTREAVMVRVGEARWAAWVEAYFHERPAQSFELNENAAGFGEFVARQAGSPAWLGELAALEWATWRAESGPDDPRDSAEGPLRAARSVVVLRGSWDVAAWLGEEAWAAEPVRGETATVVWRDGELDACRATPIDEELAAIEAALAGAPEPWGADEVVEDLLAAGIFVGARSGHAHEDMSR